MKQADMVIGEEYCYAERPNSPCVLVQKHIVPSGSSRASHVYIRAAGEIEMVPARSLINTWNDQLLKREEARKRTAAFVQIQAALKQAVPDAVIGRPTAEHLALILPKERMLEMLSQAGFQEAVRIVQMSVPARSGEIWLDPLISSVDRELGPGVKGRMYFPYCMSRREAKLTLILPAHAAVMLTDRLSASHEPVSDALAELIDEMSAPCV